MGPFDRDTPLVLDGGLASELEARGFALQDRLWSARALLDAPEILASIHRDYLNAGADVITTATYQATIPGFVARRVTEDEARRAIVEGVAIAVRERDARKPGALVAASIGSYGAFLADGSEYRGAFNLGVEALAAWHRPRLRLLEDSGADLLAFETIPSLPEIEAIVRLLGETGAPPAWISLQARDEEHLADGSAIEEAAALASRSDRVVAVGVNCVPPERALPLLRAIRSATSKPLVAYPNRGDVWDAVGRRWIPRGHPIDWARWVPRWVDAGARLVGGCCRTTPADVREISGSL
ncbi:MAG TPA: homocysteine S-methyltransferase [Candidatus Polarisedimenticolaceae bacterium]|nr:homocysteine S-methyltransferase [Candidatus Polarisedimenticolaceae bacterium]